MNYSDLDLPVPYHETFDVIDASKLTKYMRCPRSFFYTYILGWQPELTSIHLGFGSAWHAAMEVFMRAKRADVGMSYEDVLPIAIEDFQATYDEIYPPDLMLNMGETWGKNPGNAYEALAKYAKTYEHDDFETQYVEIAGTVPVRDDRVMHFKLDSVIADSAGIWSMEHKTTSRNTSSWVNQWQTSVQVGMYLHVLYMAYGQFAQGIRINGAIIRKGTRKGPSNDFLRVPVRKTGDMMHAWLGMINEALARLDNDMQRLAECSAEDEVMHAFYKNPEGCAAWGCPLMGMCSAVANPLRRADSPPPGFKVEFWDPRRTEDEASKILRLEKGDTLS